jgi:hypothetical protein
MATAYETPAETTQSANGTATDNGINGQHSSHLQPSLFAPPTPQEIAQRLTALQAFGDPVRSSAEGKKEQLDISGERSDFYSYTEREDAQR